jgi:hypothetical protein
MATNWMILGDNHGEELQAVAYSPSKLADNFDRAFIDDLGRRGLENYSPFEFSHSDIPESFVQEALTPWESEYKIDQLPNNISEEDVAEQLQDAGYDKVGEKGDFAIYSDGSQPHAIGGDRHIMIFPGGGVSGSKAERLMDRLIKEGNQDAYEVPEAIRDGLDALDVGDSLTIENTLEFAGYTQSTGSESLQPEYGLGSVDFETKIKTGAWPFQSESQAERAASILSRKEGELMDGYQDVGRQGRVVTASGGNYELGDEMNDGRNTRFSMPRI